MEDCNLPIFGAIQENDVKLLKSILQHPESKDTVNSCSEDITPLKLAAIMGNVQCVSLLLDHGADANAVDSTGATSLHHAALSENGIEIIELLLSHKANVNAQTSRALTALDWASRAEHTKVVDYLRSSGGLPSKEIELRNTDKRNR